MVEKLKCNERLKITLDITIHWKIKWVIKSKPQIFFQNGKKTKTQEIKRRGQKEKRRYRQICQEHIMEEQYF